ncbi:hypothetical protein N9N28_04835 [Rubripirellula amarantea]|uniref:Uncharacterized protein n=1 Tax=Rubripirellula amarantea TaxID=2527999 RepID=A0A5C5WJD5_9BACT|nr:DUF6666 family protein [Rubripirellula amarantea]MDA8743941.1 hypothetical protein [Rubripirellula amarantea]TWT50259.1 hypothetical protein Pla22_30000 [Rubripirellula amarantea]
MITSNATFRGWATTAIFFCMLGIAVPPVNSGAADGSVENSLRRTNQATKTTVKQRSRSMVAQAAHGRIPTEMPEAPLDGSLLKNQIKQVGFFDGCPNGCGDCCDCDVTCGAEGVYMDPACGAEPGCGVEQIFMDPSCGLEASCGFEPGCGVEPGCGIEASCGLEPGCGIEASCGLEHMGDCSCDACSSCDVSSIPLFLPMLRVQWCRFDFFAGVQGFKGPLNYANTSSTNPNVRSGSGSFGFYEGFNEGRSLKKLFGWDMAAQLGLRATQSSLYGSEFTDESRQQVFVTAGLFRRVDYGLQYGAVLDYLNEDWWYQADLLQIRGEVSWKTNGCHVFGVQYMAGLSDSTSTTAVQDSTNTIFAGSISIEPTDQYRVFYRRLLNRSGDWTAFIGGTDREDTLLGAGMNLPLTQKLLLNSSATFLIPAEADLNRDFQDETWNISLGLTYRPGGPKGCGRYCRPLFDVADNGTMMVDYK